MSLWEGRTLQDEKYTCKCEDYSGHIEWRCINCGQPIIISGELPDGREVACYRISPDALEEGMYFLVNSSFHKVLHIFDPIDDERMYINLQGYGNYKVDRRRYVLIMYQ